MSKNATIDTDPDTSRSEERTAERARDAELVARVRADDPDAFAELYQTWFERVYNVALRIAHDPQIAAETTQETFLAAWRGLPRLGDPASFGGWVLRIARNGALNRTTRESRTRPVGPEGVAMIEATNASPSSAPTGFGLPARLADHDDPAVAVADGEIASLVNEVADALGERDHEVLELQLRHQLTPAEIGEVLDLNRNAANQLCHRVRSRFAAAFGARLVWGARRHRCQSLDEALSAAGVERFDAGAIQVVTRHFEDCEDCDEQRRTRLAPAALFSAMPLAAVPLATRMMIDTNLAEVGVPVTRTSGLGAGEGSDHAAHGTNTGAATSAGRHAAWSVLAGAAALAVVALVIALLAGRSTPHQLIATAPEKATTTDPGSAPSTAATSASIARQVSPTTRNDTEVFLLPQAPTVQPSTSEMTTVAPRTTVPATRVSVERFTLDASEARPPTYARSEGPLLTWAVTGAQSVEIWRQFDPGYDMGLTQTIISTDPSGSLRLCPGTMIAPDTCSAPSGRYTYSLSATGADGTAVTGPAPPGFDVLQPVIN